MLHSRFDTPIRHHRSGLRQMKSCFSGSAFVDWLIEESYFSSRNDAVDFGAHLMAIGLVKHSEFCSCALGEEVLITFGENLHV